MRVVRFFMSSVLDPPRVLSCSLKAARLDSAVICTVPTNRLCPVPTAGAVANALYQYDKERRYQLPMRLPKKRRG